MHNKLSPAQHEAVQGLLAFLPALQNTEPNYLRNGYWSEILSIISAQTAQQMFRYLYDHGFVMPDFDWQSWDEEALSYLDQREKLRTADWPVLYQLLTTHIRADGFIQGHYDALLESGFLRDVLTRMKELLENE